MSNAVENTANENLFNELSTLIEQSKQRVSVVANSTLTLLFWQVGKRINDAVLNNERAEYGKQIVATVSAQLENKYGRNFNVKNVRRMMQFSGQFSDSEIVVPLARQLTWSHFLILIPLKSTEAKLYYAQKSIEEVWGKRELRNQISRKAFERKEIANIQLSKFPVELQNTFKIFLNRENYKKMWLVPFWNISLCTVQ